MSDERIMRNILAGPERKILIVLARHMPSWVVPDHLTWLGLLGSFVALLAYLGTWINPAFFGLASVGIIMNWFGDSLDGNLARYRQQERPIFGFFFDQTIDLLSTLLIALGLGLSIGARLDLCLLALAGYFAINCSTLIEYSISRKFFVATSWVGPTELRIIIVLFNFCLQMVPVFMMRPLALGLSIADYLVLLLAVNMWYYYCIQFIRNYRQLSSIDEELPNS